jgi:hypothetical protein
MVGGLELTSATNTTFAPATSALLDDLTNTFKIDGSLFSQPENSESINTSATGSTKKDLKVFILIALRNQIYVYFELFQHVGFAYFLNFATTLLRSIKHIWPKKSYKSFELMSNLN